MKAVVITGQGGPEVMSLREVPAPEPGRGEVRVRIRATAVNRADLLQCLGRYPAPLDAPSDIPGLEFAGEVEKVGPGVRELVPGDRVFGLTGGGAYAEAIVVHARTLARVPSNLSDVEAAAVPEAFITAFDALTNHARVGLGDDVLIHAVGSGVGTAAVQLAAALGARPLGTSRSAAKLDRAQALGLDTGFVPAEGAFADAVLAATKGSGVHAIVDLVGGAYVEESLRCLRPQGRLVLVGLMAGTRATLDLGVVLSRRVTLRGTVLRSRPIEEKIEATRAFDRHVVPLLERGRLRAVVDRVFGLSQVADAHRHVATNQGFGKVVLEIDR